MTRFKNEIYLLIYMVSSIFYEIRLLLFRAYLFLMFTMRMGGAIVVSAAAGGVFLALEKMETNWLSMAPEWAFLPVQRFRDEVLASELFVGIYDPSHPYGYLIATGLLTLALFVAIRVATKISAPVVYAFPMPRRPLPPVLRWIPPEHKIEAVKAAIATPRRRAGRWNGDWQAIAHRLPERLQALLHTEAPQSVPVAIPVPSVMVVTSEPALAPSGASETPSAPRGRYIPPGGASQSPMPS